MTEKTIDSLRLKIDYLAKLVKANIRSKEMTSSFNNLRMAKAFLGEAKVFLLNSKSPYTPANKIDEMPKTKEVSNEPVFRVGEKDVLPLINEIRAEIVVTIQKLVSCHIESKDIDKAIVELKTAKFNLGFVLAAIRDGVLVLATPNKPIVSSSTAMARENMVCEKVCNNGDFDAKRALEYTNKKIKEALVKIKNRIELKVKENAKNKIFEPFVTIKCDISPSWILFELVKSGYEVEKIENKKGYYKISFNKVINNRPD